jgi:type III pantothenate kinase
MNLCVDIGNSRVKIGLFLGEMLVQQLIWTDWTMEQLVALGKKEGVKNALFSTVAPPDPAIKATLSTHFNTLELTAETPLPFDNQYTTPQTLGKDRLAAVAGAQALFPGENCLVIDCGTCIKYEMLTAVGTYLGGNIAPGLNMRIQAMHHFTARLPVVPPVMPAAFIGNSTETALQNGALRGTCLEIEGFIHLFELNHAPLKVLLTGGDAPFLATFLTPSIDSVVPELTLYGLNSILHFNL